jgi:DTW domain-containing protein YfiP
MEAKKERVGTGRLSHLCLTNSKIIIDEKFDHHHEVQDMLQNPNYQNYLLYPGKCSHNLDHSIPENFSIPQKERNIFVLDGTWSSAKSMMRDSLTLHQIPRISFDPVKSSEFFIKRQPSSLCLSTIESIYHVLESLNKWNIESLAGQHGNLLTLLNELCQFQDACASNPSLPRYRPGVFKKSKVMKQSKKWLSRKIYFE